MLHLQNRKDDYMPYTVQSSEKLRKTGSDFETKAMLYLMNFREDSSSMNYFVVDFFNDITGMDRYARKLWDVQSKASQSATAKAIGRELVTLFKNYVSDFEFHEYILFLGAVPDTFRENDSVCIFQADNIKGRALKSVFDGLKDECQKKEYIDNNLVTDDLLNKFLASVWFVIDDKQPQDYIRAIIKNHPKLIPADSDLIAIFNEIRNKQAEKKNSLVEGVVINQIDEVLGYGRHLTTNEIRMLVLQRIINTDPLAKGIPEPFMEVYVKYPEEHRKSMIDQCQSSLCRALFNKSAAQGFWQLFENIYELLQEYPEKTIDFIYNKVDSSAMDACPDFDVLSLKFFISKIKEGILQ